MPGSLSLTDLDRRYARWSRLAGADKRRLIAFVIALPLIDLALRTVGLKRTDRWMAARSDSAALRACAADDLIRAEHLAHLIAVAGRHGIYRATCLRQALLLKRQLRKQGLPAILRIGVRKSNGSKPDAHAWIELDGHALGDVPADYRAFEPDDVRQF